MLLPLIDFYVSDFLLVLSVRVSRLLLFENEASERAGESTALGNLAERCQKDLHDFIGNLSMCVSIIICLRLLISRSAANLFHWEPVEPGESEDERVYSIRPADYPRLPLFKIAAPDGKKVLLNMVFWLVFDQVPTWQSLANLHVSTLQQVETLVRDDYPEFADSPSGKGMAAVPKISKTFIGYLSGLLAVSPFYRSMGDERVKGLAEAQRDRFYNLAKPVPTDEFKDYLARKLKEWYSAVPGGVCSGDAAAEEEGAKQSQAPADGASGAARQEGPQIAVNMA